MKSKNTALLFFVLTVLVSGLACGRASTSSAKVDDQAKQWSDIQTAKERKNSIPPALTQNNEPAFWDTSNLNVPIVINGLNPRPLELATIRANNLAILKAAGYNWKQRYQTLDSYKSIKADGLVIYYSLSSLAAVADIADNQKERNYWRRRVADFYLFPHATSKGKLMSRPDLAAIIYRDIGDKADAQRAALLAGKLYLTAFLDGVLDDSTHMFRDPLNQYDLAQAKMWYREGGMDEDKIKSEVHTGIVRAAEDCAGSRAHYDEDWCAELQRLTKG